MIHLSLEYIAHSAFALNCDGRTVLIDPFITGNPMASYDWRNRNIKDILVTHGHGDHLGDAIEIAQTKHAKITTVFELANYCASRGANANGVGLGGKVEFEWGNAWFVPAQHSSCLPDWSYAGVAAGIVMSIDAVKIYHAGDTALSSEMTLIKDVYKPDIALLPIGGHYTMGVEEAVIAAKMLGVRKVIPMHYNTFPQIKARPEDLKYKLETYGIETIILRPGEKIDLW